MAAFPSAPAGDPAPAFEIKAAAFTLPVIRLLGLDMDAVAEQLEPKVEQAPGFFLHTPVVIDLGALSDADGEVGFPQLVGLLRGLGMIPIGVRGGNASQQEAARAMELAILGDGAKSKARGASAAAAPTLPPEAGADPGHGPPARVETGSTLITRPVRSGQRVYAAGGDLTVVAAVSSGAELMADGNIHVYGPLRGRVIAGLKGSADARIFCQDLQAELVSVAGHYRVSENIPASLKGQRVQIFLDHEVLRIEPL
jgi:septum site-determining protein MinC